jgi:L,D-transpeptidase catalytic domain
MLVVAAADTQARSERSADRHVHKDKATPIATTKRSHGPLLAVVSLRSQKIAVYGSEGLIARSVVSTGRAGYPTPTGVFSIIQKRRYHRSNIYSDAPMPYMQRITWSGVALHAGVVPGYPASHGCIRLKPRFATELWHMTKVGARVVIAPDDVAARELAHAALPVPLMTPAPEEVAAASEGALVRTAFAARGAHPSQPSPRLLNPLERAHATKLRTAAEAAAKAEAAKGAARLAALKAAEGKKAIAALREADIAAAAARSRLDAVERAVVAATTLDALERARAARTAAETTLAVAKKVVAEAAAEEDSKTFAAFNAARAAWDAEEASAQAAAAAKEAGEHGAEPISVFISKKAGHIYIRQDWAPVYDAPVTFKEPEAPLGTYLYLATAPLQDGKAMRWLTVSLPSKSQGRGSARAARDMTAAVALDRVELDTKARAFIEERLWTGAALIISDLAPSEETGKFTDFIVETR